MTLYIIIGQVNPTNINAQPLGILSQQQQKEPRQEVLFSNNNRYVFGQISDSNKDKFMLDTFTGRLWRIAESGDVGLHLKPIPYLDKNGKTMLVPQDSSKNENNNVDKRE